MRALLSLVAGLMAAAPVTAQDAAALLGRQVVDVRLEADGTAIAERGVLDLVETRLGEPLDMREVRQTINHLIALGRFVDVRIFAEPAGEGVRLRYALVRVAHVVAVDFQGLPTLDERGLRNDLTDQFGARPAAARLPAMAAAIADRLRVVGYATPSVDVQTRPIGRNGDVAALFIAAAGRPTVVRRATIEGPASATRGVLDRLGLATGRPLPGDVLATRAAAVEDALRAQGFYEAVVSTALTPVAPEEIDVAVRVNPGDPVDVVFTGDPLSEERRRALVPIARLQSVEEEVLEDASRNIEEALRLEGYRSAAVQPSRQRTGGRLRIAFDVQRGPLYVLGRASIVGARAIAASELAPLMKLEAGEAFVDARVATVAAALAELYRVRGFVDARVTMDVTFPEASDVSKVPVDVQLTIVEGRRVVVTEVRVEGADAVAAETLLEGTGLSVGKPYYRPQHALDREILERRYRSLGYQRAVVEARVLANDEGASILVYAVREGPQTVVDHVLVTGSTRTSPDLVRREITLTPGSPLGYDAIIESQQRLSALGLFRRVRITQSPHGADERQRDVVVELEDAPPTGVSYGGGLEMGQFSRRSGDGTAVDRFGIAPRGFFEVTRRNLFGKNRSLSLLTSVSLRPTDPGFDAGPDVEGGYGLNQYRVIGTVREPRAFGSAGDAQISAFTERGIRASFNYDRLGVRAEYARRAGRQVRLIGRYSYDYTTLFDTKIAAADQLLVDRLFPQVGLSALFASVLRDSRNDVLDPERGTVLGSDLELALRSIGSEVGFVKGFAQTFAYRRLPGSRPFVVSGGARVGLAHGFARRVPRQDASGQPVIDADGRPIVDVVRDLPASARFFTGGDTTVRGFALDRLGSRATLNSAGFPTGGNALVVLNLELRTPYVKGVGLVGFVDSGNVFLRAADVDLGELRTAAGLGLRYRSPLGPLRFDVGFKLDRRDFARGERRVVYHLSLGQAF